MLVKIKPFGNSAKLRKLSTNCCLGANLDEASSSYILSKQPQDFLHKTYSVQTYKYINKQQVALMTQTKTQPTVVHALMIISVQGSGYYNEVVTFSVIAKAKKIIKLSGYID